MIRRNTVLALSVLASSLLLAGCGAETAGLPFVDVEQNDEGASVATATTVVAPGEHPETVRVRAGAMTLWMDPVALPQMRDGEFVLRMRGRVSRDLEEVFSWVPDDAYGEARILSPRTFELLLESGHEQNTVLSGSPIFVRIKVKNVESYYNAPVWLAPRFNRFEGSSRIWIEDEIRPVLVVDGVTDLRYRGAAKTDGNATDFQVITADDNNPDVARVSADRWRFDWGFETLLGAGDPPEHPVGFHAEMGGTFEKFAGIDFAISQVGLTIADPWEVFPSPSCEADVRACMTSLAAGATDFGACGTYVQVRTCRNEE